jgi:hypothetical protein
MRATKESRRFKVNVTAADFKKWEAKARAATNESIEFVIKDCVDAARAMSGHNPDAEARYWDEAHTYVEERRRRAKKK